MAGSYYHEQVLCVIKSHRSGLVEVQPGLQRIFTIGNILKCFRKSLELPLEPEIFLVGVARVELDLQGLEVAQAGGRVLVRPVDLLNLK